MAKIQGVGRRFGQRLKPASKFTEKRAKATEPLMGTSYAKAVRLLEHQHLPFEQLRDNPLHLQIIHPWPQQQNYTVNSHLQTNTFIKRLLGHTGRVKLMAMNAGMRKHGRENQAETCQMAIQLAIY